MLPLLMIGGTLLGSGLILAGQKLRRIREKNQANNLSGGPDDREQSVISSGSPTRNKDALEADEEKREVDHYLKSSSVGLACALSGYVLYSPLMIPAIALTVYSSYPVLRAAGKSLSKGEVRASTVDSIAIIGGLTTGYYLASSLVSVVYFSAIKLMVKTEDQSRMQLGNIFGEQPRTVWLSKDGAELEVPFEALLVDDVIVLHAGELIPIDGVVAKGHALVDQHAMTGESQPADKSQGDQVLAGTVIVEGQILVRVEKRGQDTVAAQIGTILQNTADFRSSVESKGLILSNQMALPTLIAGGVALGMLGPVSGVALVSCNFSEIVRVVGPLGVLNFLKLATNEGVLIKDGRSLELLSSVDTVVFDKTGTLTIEQPHVSELHVWGEISQDELLRLAAAAEYKQKHPIARAILDAAQTQGLSLPAIDNARYEIGYGMKVSLEQKTVYVGSQRFMQMEAISLPKQHETLQHHCQDNGHSLVYVAINDQVVGAVELHATLRPEVRDVIQALRKRNLKICIISGDQEKPTRHLAQSLGIDDYFAETLPENKAKLIEELQQQGRSVCFVGDGINDAIALKKANVSISIQGASTAATDSAGIILMDKGLNKLPWLFELASGLEKNMRKSFAAALAPGAAGAVGVFLFHFGIYGALMLYITSLIAGTTNAMAPLITYRFSKNQKRLDSDSDQNDSGG